MEPTLTLDNDVAVALQEEAARRGRTLRQLANDFLRRSLNKLRQSKPAKPFIVRARPLGLRPELNYACTDKLIEQFEKCGFDQ